MAATLRQIALVSESTEVDASEIAVVSAALQKQVARDLAPIWGIHATGDGFGSLDDVPVDYWPIIVKDDIGYSGAAGIHLDDSGQPFALVTASSDDDVWSLTASHEALEMLVDPFGNRQVAGDSPKPDQGRVSFLVEVCDPSEAATFAYSVNGVLVSDFYTPHFFDPFVVSGRTYSFTGGIKAPRQVLRGGYLSWLDPASNSWWQETWFTGDRPEFVELGPLSSKGGSLRTQIDRLTETGRRDALGRGRRVATASGLGRRQVRESTTEHSRVLRAQIDDIVASSRQRSGMSPAGPAGFRPASVERRNPGRIEDL